MNKKIFVLLILGIFFISLASATLPSVKQDECINIRTISNSSAVNISSITYPAPNQTTLYLDEPMTQNGKTFNYTFCATSVPDYYVYDYYDAEGNIYVNDFKVTASGRVTTTSESILYFIFTFIIFAIFLVMLYFIIVLPYANERNENDKVILITRYKYIKVILIAFAYPVFLILLNLMNGLAQNFVSLSIFGGTIGFLFSILISNAWIFTLLIIIWIFYLLIRDTNFKKLIKSKSYY